MNTNRFTPFKESLRHFFSFARKSGIRKFHLFSLNTSDSYLNLAMELLEEIKLSKDPLRELEKLTYKQIELGDLIYDQYLRLKAKPTVDLEDSALITLIHNALLYSDKLLEYFATHTVKAVIVGETTYQLAIPARVALGRGVNVYHVTSSTIYRLSKETGHAYKESVYFKTYAEKYLDSKEVVGPTHENSFQPSFRSRQSFWANILPSNQTLRFNQATPNKEINIVVACHDFYDAPHVYGVNLFPDFYQWLDFLGELSTQTDYKWYLKRHPLERADSSKVYKELQQKYPNFVILSRETVNTDLLNMRISAVLTVYGTVALEFTQLGIPVINASTSGPYHGWSFCINPKNVDDYREVLLQVSNLSLNPGHYHEITRFLKIEQALLSELWFLEDGIDALQSIRATEKGHTWDIFSLLDHNFYSRMTELEAALDSFIQSKEYFLHKGHFKSTLT
jgi:hypothetical protein